MINAPAFKGMVAHCDALRQCVLKELPGLAERIIVAHNGADSLPKTSSQLISAKRAIGCRWGTLVICIRAKVSKLSENWLRGRHGPTFTWWAGSKLR